MAQRKGRTYYGPRNEIFPGFIYAHKQRNTINRSGTEHFVRSCSQEISNFVDHANALCVNMVQQLASLYQDQYRTIFKQVEIFVDI